MRSKLKKAGAATVATVGGMIGVASQTSVASLSSNISGYLAVIGIHGLPATVLGLSLDTAALLVGAAAVLCAFVWLIIPERTDAPALSGRMVVDPLQLTDPKDGKRNIRMHLRNIGPGAAYGGTHGFAVMIVPGDKTPATDEIDRVTAQRIAILRSSVIRRTSTIEVGEKFFLELEAEIPNDVWLEVLSGAQKAYFWCYFSFSDEATPKSRIKISGRVSIYSHYDGKNVKVTTIESTSKTYRRNLSLNHPISKLLRSWRRDTELETRR